MLPLIPSLVLALFSFICSAFVILRVVIPILPPHPLSRRVAPSEFGLPNFRSLSAADKSHIWLASLDLLALAMILWQVITESLGSPSGHAIAQDPMASVRMWLALTLRQTCLLVVVSLTLLHVRMGRSVSFGTKHWMLWAPIALLVVTSTSIAGVLSGASVPILFAGLLAYCSTFAVISTVTFGCLIGTLIIIKRNLASLNDDTDDWPITQIEEKPRPSFATEEVDGLKDGASWITSTAGSHSRHGSASAWSFSTHHTVTTSQGHGGRPQGPHNASVPAKSSFWFGNSTTNLMAVPPVPPLPSPYGPLSPTSASLTDPDPFRRESPSPSPSFPEHPRERLGSQTSWLTSTQGSHTTVSAWSFPATQRDDISEHYVRNGSTTNVHTTLLPSGTAVSRPTTPAMCSAQVLGGYGYAPSDTEKNLSALAATANTSLDISLSRAIGWMFMIWVPMGLCSPYLINAMQNVAPSFVASVLLVLSVTTSSPILALNILLRSPMPIPANLFDNRSQLPKSSTSEYVHDEGSLPPPRKLSHNYKSSTRTSTTIVEGRRSGDVWITNGDAVAGKSKLGRAVEMLSPRPKLSVLPPEDADEPERPPPVPFHTADASLPSIIATPRSETSEQFGRIRTESKASSHLSGGDASLGFASQIMIAQRHYSTLARTMRVSTSPEKENFDSPLAEEGESAHHLDMDDAVASGIRRISTSHLRTRSVSSIIQPSTPTRDAFNPSPPPSFPLPPTPPNVRAHRLAKHKKSYSSGFSFGAVDNLNEIDALTAGVLPILVPGLTVGKEMKIRNGDWNTKSKGKTGGRKFAMEEFGHGSGADFSSPEFHSTPVRSKPALSRARKESHKRAHFSLPSLGLGKDGVHSLALEIGKVLESYVTPPSTVDTGRRATVFGADSVPNYLPTANGGLQAVPEERRGADLARALSTRSLGLRAEVPHNVDTARSSILTVERPLPSAASTVTLFEFGKDIDGIDFENFEKGLEDGPVAESTPHNPRAGRHGNRENDTVPPLPTRAVPAPPRTKEKRRSSIVYIKSDENRPPPVSQAEASTGVTRMQSFVRAVRPLMPKKKHSPKTPASASPQQGLRPLSLLQSRDLNASPPPGAVVGRQGMKPLSMGKAKGRTLTPSDGLNRSETSKLRATLRENEALPDVHVRPPSHTPHQPFAYTFRS